MSESEGNKKADKSEKDINNDKMKITELFIDSPIPVCNWPYAAYKFQKKIRTLCQ